MCRKLAMKMNGEVSTIHTSRLPLYGKHDVDFNGRKSKAVHKLGIKYSE